MYKQDLLNWKEFGVLSAPSITTAFEKQPYAGIDKIVQYLEHGTAHLSAPGGGIDAVTGKQVAHIREIRNDGEYAWSSMLPYYVKHYNMRLPAAFENKVMTN